MSPWFHTRTQTGILFIIMSKEHWTLPQCQIWKYLSCQTKRNISSLLVSWTLALTINYINFLCAAFLLVNTVSKYSMTSIVSRRFQQRFHNVTLRQSPSLCCWESNTDRRCNEHTNHYVIQHSPIRCMTEYITPWVIYKIHIFLIFACIHFSVILYIWFRSQEHRFCLPRKCHQTKDSRLKCNFIIKY